MLRSRSLQRRAAEAVRALAIVSAFCASAFRTASAGPLFPNPAFDVAGGPGPMVLADVNGDGIQDLVTGNAGSPAGDPGSLSVLLGPGDGRFVARDPISLSARPSDLVAADFNLDGRPDLAVLHADLGFFSIFLGAGDGSFAESAVLSAFFRPARGAGGDFNLDGKPDVVVAGSTAATPSQGYVVVYLGDGAGGVAAGPVLAAGSRPNGVAVADLNGDGVEDVVVSDEATGSSTIFLNRGDGILARSGSLVTGERPAGLTLADFDADGNADLAIGAFEDSGVSPFHGFKLFRGRGDGTFDGTPVYQGVTFVSSLTAGDVNGDGALDLLVTYDFFVEVFMGDGAGTFAPPSLYQVGLTNRRTVVGSFDEDGLPDLAVAAEGSRAVFVLAGRGDGAFGPVPAAPSIFTALRGMVAADLDGNGFEDLAVADYNASAVAVLLGHGDGTLEPPLYHPTDMPPEILAAADLDHDGRMDLAVTHSSCDPRYPCPNFPVRSVVLVLQGQGNGRFKSGDVAPAGYFPAAIAPADLDGDGALDLVVANGGDLGWGLEGDLTVLMGTGSGNFSKSFSFAPGIAPRSVAVSDFDADGRPDLALAHAGDPSSGDPGALSILPGLGDGTFGSPLVLQDGPAGSVTLSDLDADGLEDIAALSAGALRVFRAQGGGAFVQAEPRNPGVSPFGLIAADLTGDGHRDLLLAGGGKYISLYPGRGDGTFDAEERFGYGGIFAVAAGDFVAGGPSDLALDADYNGLFLLSATPPGFFVRDFAIDFSSPLGRGSGTVMWTTERETDLMGFNVVTINNQGRRVQQNPVLIPCQECLTGLGAAYTYFIPKHRGARDVFLEAVRLDGSIETFGPATRR